jgi:hypothetical protein
MGMKLVGITWPPPACGQRSLDPLDAAVVERERRLIEQYERALLEGSAQSVLQATGGLQLQIHFCGIKQVLAAPLVFGSIERQVGISEQQGGVAGITRIECDTDTGAHVQLAAADIERLGHGIDDLPGDDRDAVWAGYVFPQQNELVAADARERVALAQAVAKPVGDLPQ